MVESFDEFLKRDSEDMTESQRQRAYRTFRVEGTESILNRLENFLRYLQRCSTSGHSALVGLAIDGDGPDRFLLQGSEPYTGKILQGHQKQVEIP